MKSENAGLAPVAGLSLIIFGMALAVIIGTTAHAWRDGALRGDSLTETPIAQYRSGEPTLSETRSKPAERRRVEALPARPTPTRVVFGAAPQEAAVSAAAPASVTAPAEPGIRTAQASFIPSLKPRRRPEGVPVVTTIDPGAVYRASSEPLAFVSADDFTGGRENLFAAYAQAQADERAELAYMTVVLNRGETLTQTLNQLGASSEETARMLEAAGTVTEVGKVEAGTAIDYAFEPVLREMPSQPLEVGEEGDAAPETDTDVSGEAQSPQPAPVEEGASAEVAAADPPVAGADILEAGDPASESYDLALVRLRFRPDERHVVVAWREPDGEYKARIEELEIQKRFAAVGGVINHSLFMAAQRADVPPEVMQRFANLFLYDIDFARDIFAGDRFEAVYEVLYDSEGNYVGSGDIVFAAMSWRGGRHRKGYYRFDGAEGMEMPYFDLSGESATRLLMKTPIEGARVTSGFGMRKHPILGYTKGHKGVDFGAPRGTPIMAAGDGVIERAAPTGTYGNYIKIKHNSGFETAYAHLNGFAKGIRSGAKVRQGDIIGYVGTTGRSTGPHLHYEVLRAGEWQNPMTLNVANGRVLEGGLLAEFTGHRDFLDTLRVHPYTIASAQPDSTNQ